ncbi:MAG: hypothetical protein FWG36_02135 [Oscillospiraceae bacterium]|nr:hypothetical protein [Oscillospiraceae bacterium]
MHCEFIHCIYNKDLNCSIDGIYIDNTGQCSSSMMLWLPDNKLEEYKNNNIKELNDRYNSWEGNYE